MQEEILDIPRAEKNEDTPLRVTHVKGANEIWARYISFDIEVKIEINVFDDEINGLDCIFTVFDYFFQGELNNFYGNYSLCHLTKDIKIGRYYAVQEQNHWHRVKILKYDSEKAKIFFIDTGCEMVTDGRNLRVLASEFYKLPQQVIITIYIFLSKFFRNQHFLECAKFALKKCHIFCFTKVNNFVPLPGFQTCYV